MPREVAGVSDTRGSNVLEDAQRPGCSGSEGDTGRHQAANCTASRFAQRFTRANRRFPVAVRQISRYLAANGRSRRGGKR